MTKTLIVVALLAAGCGKKSDDAGNGVVAKASDDKPANDKTTKADDAGAIERLAFSLGRKVGLYEAFEVTNKDTTSKATDLKSKVKVLADGLGVDVSLGKGANTKMYAQIETKHGKRTAGLFALGYEIDHGMLGAMLKVDLKSSLEILEMLPAKLDIPESVWKAPLAKLEANPSGDAFDDFGAAINDYLKK